MFQKSFFLLSPIYFGKGPHFFRPVFWDKYKRALIFYLIQLYYYFNLFFILFFRRKRKRRDATGKIDYDRPPDYNLPHVPHPPGNVTVG